MRVLAIDPGYGRCGIAIIEKENGKERLLHSECVETSAREEFPTRLLVITEACERALRAYRPDVLAIEKIYFAKNQKTAMRVAEIRGALIQLAMSGDIPVFEYAPTEVKVAAGGYGHANKRQTEKMLRTLLKINKKIRHDDEYDAIAIGLTHLTRTR